ncbi:hypothetical protein FNF29_03870 [Cafeteria roenbergensis]|uniref:Protein kinase domain-containing protein n=1 Tax=Cafeteria roenbergensis TaxID=33653 RepID=A0A5A8CIJ2_CAFRO|nr:hypothetical protein FNF29_03870 [Cafeteria roenbergensis]|eukprot:KAA0152304.1 hypothetical protein FNF29_03870 [Cafeteria roenbergensis]
MAATDAEERVCWPDYKFRQLLGTGSFARVFAAGVTTTATRPAARRPLFGDAAASRSAPLDMCGSKRPSTAVVCTALGARKLPRVVAVKQYNRAALREPAMRDMVMAEARAMRDAGDHENVCRLLDAFEDHRGRVTEARGSLVYMAPEALVRGHTHHARPTDVWSLGVCFYLMLTGSFPFRGDSEAEVIRMVRTRPPNAKADGLPAGHPASELTLRLLDRSAATRPTAEAVCADPWLRGGAAGERSPEAQDGGDVATQAELVDVTTIPTAPVPVRPRAAGRHALAVDVSDAADSKPLAGMSADQRSHRP